MLTIVKVGSDLVVVEVVVVVITVVPFAVVVVSTGSVISVVETSLSVVNIGVSSVVRVVVLVPMVIVGSVLEVEVSGKPVCVVSKGYTVVETSSKRIDCLFINLYNTNTDTPRASMVPKMRRTERSLGRMLFWFSFHTCPFSTSFTGWRKKTTLASFPFIFETEPKKAMHLQLVKVCVLETISVQCQPV